MSERDLITGINQDTGGPQEPIKEPAQKEHWIREQRDNRDLGSPRGTRKGEWRPCPLCAAGIPDHH